MNRIVTEPPDSAARGAAMAPREPRDAHVGLLQQQGRARRRAAARDERGFDETHRHARCRELAGDERARHPAADDRDVGFAAAFERRVSLSWSIGGQPHRPTAPQGRDTRHG